MKSRHLDWGHEFSLRTLEAGELPEDCAKARHTEMRCKGIRWQKS